MIRIFISMVLLFTWLTAATGQARLDIPLPAGETSIFLAGEHTPVIYRITLAQDHYIVGCADACTTAWFDIGASPYASDADNRNIGIFNPECFTVGIKMTWSFNGDSCQINKAYFETCYQTTDFVFWNADSSNFFIDGDCYSHDDYGDWRYQTLLDTSRFYLYTCRVWAGSKMRVILESGIEDSVDFDLFVISEN